MRRIQHTHRARKANDPPTPVPLSAPECHLLIWVRFPIPTHDGLLRYLKLATGSIHTLRDRVERTFAWEDKFKRLLLRFEHIQQRHYGMKLMAYTLIHVRHFCGT